MKSLFVFLAIVLALVAGFVAGNYGGRLQARIEVMTGPYSDNFASAREELAQALSKLPATDDAVKEHLVRADTQLEHAQKWTEEYLSRR